MRRIVLPVRLYHAISTIGTLGASCLLSSVIVFLLDHFTDMSLSLPISLGICSILTMLIGGVALAWEAGRYIRPAKDVMDGAAKVAAGDFSVRIPLPDWRIGIAEGYSLIENFNRMTEELSGLDQMRRDFTAGVSHEFKTPLSSIVGFTEILIDGGIEEKEQQEYLALVHEEAFRLSRLAENLLRLSRLDAQVIVRHEKVCIDEQIRQCVILLTNRQISKEIFFDVDLPVMTIESDKDMLKEIWVNLIDNAIKYLGNKKNIYIKGENRSNNICVRIRDEGIGIPPEKQGRIFERFYQCDESHKGQGHGLGLSIVKRILELLEGNIECKSEEGKGTEMIITLPKVIGVLEKKQ